MNRPAQLPIRLCLSLLFFIGVAKTPAATINVDPAAPALTNYTTLGDWNTDGNFEGWTLSQCTTQVVSNGVLAAVSGGVNPHVDLSNLASGPDLDLGYNTYLELRVQVPASYTGAIQVLYGVANAGVSGQSGFSTSRVAIINSSLIPKDGAFHIYRVDMGLEPLWRGTLRDLRVDPVSVAGLTFALDYVRIGDQAGEVYYPRYSVSNPAPGAANDQGRETLDLESKHFRFLWDAAVATNSFWTANMPRGSLRNAEQVWQVYVKQLGYKEPAESWTPALRDGRKYKVNITTWYGGYWAGGDTGDFGRLNITPDGLRVDPPTWVLPHEGMHVFQMHQGGGFTGNDPMGPWWEAHANYGRERWLYAMNRYFDSSPTAWSAPGSAFVRTAQMFHGHGVHYYDHWPLFLYLDENPDGLAELAPGADGRAFSARVWQDSLAGEYIYNTIDRFAPTVGIKDLMGYCARRSVIWDYSHRTNLQASLNTQDPELIARLQITELRARSDDPSWWQVAPECAPMQYAYAAHELAPTGAGAGRVVTVDFHGLPNTSRLADWRASFVVVNDAGTARYSSLWNAGPNSVTLAANENKLYLTVAATPGQIIPSLQMDGDQPYDSHPARVRFPYEIQVFGAVPREATNSASGLVKHSNGGGYKASTATVDSTAYVGPNARVLNSAQVRGYARIEDFAVVKHTALVSDNAVVSGHALLRHNSRAQQHAKVRDFAMLSDNAIVTATARVGGHASLSGDVIVTNSATVKGAGYTWRTDVGDRIGGDAVLDGDCVNGQTVTNGFQFGWEWGGLSDATIAAHTAPAGLFAAYECSASDPLLAHDHYGVTDGLLRGNPTWTRGDAWRAGFLSFNGTNDFVALDRWPVDFSTLTLMAWVRWSGGASNQPIGFFGAGVNQGFWLTPDDGSGHARLVVRSNTLESGLTLPLALPVGTWAHLAVTWSNTLAQCYVNGAWLAQGDVGARAAQLLPANANTAPVHCYLARGADAAQPFFAGALDSVRFYSRVLSDAEIAVLITPAPPASGGMLAQYLFNETTGTIAHDSSGNNNDASLVNNPTWTSGALTFDGTSNYVQTPVTNGSTRTLAAWIYPHTSDSVSYIESVFDTDVPGQHGSGWGLNGGKFRAILDDRFWDTGVSVTLNQWQHVALAFDQTAARFYVNGALKASLSYTQGGVTSASYRIGKSHANPLYFDGLVRDARIYGRRLSDAEVAMLSSNTPPVASALALTALRNTAVAFALNASSAQGAPLTFTTSAPTNGVLGGVAPFLIYTPNPGFTGTDGFNFQVSDGQASSGAAVSILVRAPLASPVLGATLASGRFTMACNGPFGWRYTVQAATNLVSPVTWSTLLTTNAPAMPFLFTDPSAADQPSSFYRVVVEP